MPKRKATIPKPLKNKVWDYYIGKKYGIGPCYCCKRDLDSKDFECGHVQAEAKGGQTNLRNLRPICGTCNRSMRTENMYKFMNRVGFDQKNTYTFEIILILFILIIISIDVYQNDSQLMFSSYKYLTNKTSQLSLTGKIKNYLYLYF
jgi:hypothetical protein